MGRHLLAESVVLIEDRRFWKHPGIDLVATLRALFVNLRERRYAQGGSTITQQLARLVYLDRKKTLRRKLKEAVVALWLERKHGKEWILHTYLAEAYLGTRKNGTEVRGFEAAAQHYFNRTLDRTTLVQQVGLVAMLKGPGIYRPGTPKGTARATQILALLLSAGKLTLQEFADAVEALARSIP